MPLFNENVEAYHTVVINIAHNFQYSRHKDLLEGLDIGDMYAG